MNRKEQDSQNGSKLPIQFDSFNDGSNFTNKIQHNCNPSMKLLELENLLSNISQPERLANDLIREIPSQTEMHEETLITEERENNHVFKVNYSILLYFAII